LLKDRRISKPRLLDKSRAAYRRERKRDPSLPPLSPAAGKVEVKDAIRVTLPTVGGKAVYAAVPVGGWRFEFERQSYSRAAASGAKAAAPAPAAWPAITISDLIRLQADVLFDLADLERRAFDRIADLERRAEDHFDRIFNLKRRVEAHAAEAKYSPSNVVSLAAAE
jgi:hypothetical protein